MMKLRSATYGPLWNYTALVGKSEVSARRLELRDINVD